MSIKHTILTASLAALSLSAAGAGTVAPLSSSPFDAAIGAASGTNRLALIDNGYDALLLRSHLIQHAQRSVDIQTFIWTNDECGRLLMWDLIDAARRGVKVRILADHIASEQDPEVVAFLATVHPNLQIKHYRPAAERINPSRWRWILSSLSSPARMNQRMHNKVLIVDDAVLITGGRNIENTYYNHSTELNFRDRDALVVGPVVRQAVESFREYWDYRWSVPSAQLVDVAAFIAGGKYRPDRKREAVDFGGFFDELNQLASEAGAIQQRFVARLQPVQSVKFIADTPGKSGAWKGQRRHITDELGAILGQARKSIVMQTPYLVISGKARELFAGLRRRNPDLRIIVSSNSFGSTDNTMAYAANYRMRSSYIESLGMTIYEYRPRPAILPVILPQYPDLERRARQRIEQGRQQRLPFLCVHAKSLVVDDRWAFIGSYNLDPRSEKLNTEAGLLVEDPAIAAQLKTAILTDTRATNSWVIARRAMPLKLDVVNGIVDDILGLSPIDVWPIQNSTSFELVPGREEVPPDHPDFHKNYRSAGDFPGADGLLSTKEIVTRLYKVVGTVMTPIL